MKGRELRAARARGQALKATVFVGRAGVAGAAAEAATQLKSRDIVKVKVAKSAAPGRGLKAIGEELSAGAGAELVEVRGRTVLLARRSRKGDPAGAGPPEHA